MPIETQREIAWLTLGYNVKIPVITKITFQDAAERGQEYEMTIDNTPAADREVTFAWVGENAQYSLENSGDPSDPNTAPRSDDIAVERLQRWKDFDRPDRGQETWTSIDNKTYSADGPPFFTTHQKTHCVRYADIKFENDPELDDQGNPIPLWDADGNVNSPNDKNTKWIMSELIDELTVVDERGQERTYFLTGNPKTDYEASHQIEFDESGNPTNAPQLDNIDPNTNLQIAAARLDPFQNIVRIPKRQFFPNITVEVSYQGGILGLSSFHDLYISQGGTGFAGPVYLEPYQEPPPNTVDNFSNSLNLTKSVFDGLGNSTTTTLVDTAASPGEFLWPPADGEPSVKGEVSGNSWTVELRYQILTSPTVYETNPIYVGQFPPEAFGRWYRGQYGATQVAGTDSGSANDYFVTVPFDDPLKYFGQDVPVSYDTVGHFTWETSANPTSFFIILYSAKFGPPPGGFG